VEGAANNVLCKARHFLIRVEDKYIHFVVNVWKRLQKKTMFIPIQIQDHRWNGYALQWKCHAVHNAIILF